MSRERLTAPTKTWTVRCASGRSRRCRPRSCCPTGSRRTSRPGSTSSACCEHRRLVTLIIDRHDPRAEGPGLVARHGHRPLLQQHAPVAVELFFFFMVIHLWGKYWMAAWRGGRNTRVDDRGDHLPGRDPVRADRLRLAAELRRPVDLDAGEGRDELGRRRRVLQPDELRADVQLPRLPAAARRRRARRRATSCSSAATGSSAAPFDARAAGAMPRQQCRRRRPRRPGRERGRRDELAQATCARRTTRKPWARAPTRRTTSSRRRLIAVGRRALLAFVLAVLFSSPDEKPSTIRSGRGDAGRLRDDRVAGARRHERDRRIRPALQRQPGERPARRLILHLQKWLGVSHPINTAQDYRDRAAADGPRQPALVRARSPSTKPRPDQDAEGLGEAYAKPLEEYVTAEEEQKPLPSTVPSADRRVVTWLRRYGPVPTMMAGLLSLAKSGGLDGALLDQQPVLPDRLHQARCSSWPTAGCSTDARRTAAPARRAVGHDERDRQLPRPGLAVALHVLVPGRAVQVLRPTPTCS